MVIREATTSDWEAIWPIFHQVVSLGDTYGFDIDLSKPKAKQLWLDTPRKTFVIEDNHQILGTYYLKANQAGPGSHVCNCGYMVSESARGKGVAAKMCEHSQAMALSLGYKAMQFNFVASSNESALYLWTKLGFETVGRLPKAFKHPLKGFIDALVMYKWL
ncbi:GNAT family N-acetyltransferase [Reinekea marina]|uniref:GNAT family N-acetyltransferase n=1 Tax=Reinekea marina TaxID=1310421 RepID=A0ABV7WMP4_9GAMM|nr:GNAT family N-acetyltransferase [Reinekea marina]MDN3649543.1 GNAT family N-acetyltransferase [Reinekea marina]